MGILVFASQMITNIAFIVTVCTNPGILPRSNLRARTIQNITETRGKDAGGGIHPLILSTTGGHMSRIKFCNTC